MQYFHNKQKINQPSKAFSFNNNRFFQATYHKDPDNQLIIDVDYYEE